MSSTGQSESGATPAHGTVLRGVLEHLLFLRPGTGAQDPTHPCNRVETFVPWFTQKSMWRGKYGNVFFAMTYGSCVAKSFVRKYDL